MLISLHGALKLEVPKGKTFLEVFREHEEELEKLRTLHGEPLAVQWQGEFLSLNDIPPDDGAVHFITQRSSLGQKIIQRTAIFIVGLAFSKLFPDLVLHVRHSYGVGIFCELRDPVEGSQFKLREYDIQLLKEEIRRIVSEDLPIKRVRVTRNGFEDYPQLKEKLRRVIGEANIHAYRHKEYFDFYYIEREGYAEYSTIPLLPSTGFIKAIDLINYPPGLVVVLPKPDDLSQLSEFKEIPTLFQTFHEYRRWLDVLELFTLNDLNEIINKGRSDELIAIAEVLHERKVIEIVDDILRRMPDLKLILIAGPSSAGKTTFSRRLQLELRAVGLKPIVISMDDYFLDRELTPTRPDGRKDFDQPDALDKELFLEHLNRLLNGDEVELPRYNFHRGKRMPSGRKVKLTSSALLIVEGIHALNPIFSRVVPSHMKYKIYVSALAQINIDERNRVHTTDNRLLRRIVRDSLFRSYTVVDTIRQWPLVREAEDKYIFPYQDTADAMFNSALPYELAVLKPFVEPMLKTIPYYYPEYREAKRLLDLLSHVEAVSPTRVPPNSILREFIGGSIFES